MAQRLGQTVRTMACSSCATQVRDILWLSKCRWQVFTPFALTHIPSSRWFIAHRPWPYTCVCSFVKTETTTNTLKSAPGEIIRKSEFEFRSH